MTVMDNNTSKNKMRLETANPNGFEGQRGFKGLGQTSKFLLGLVLCFLLGVTAKAQKTIILIDADVGSRIESVHQFSFENSEYTFNLKHRLSQSQPLEVRLLRSDKFEVGPYSLEQSLPMTIAPGESKALTFKVDYGKSIRDRSSATFLISPAGDKDPTARGITFHVQLSAKGKVMFWDDRANRYFSSLPTNNPFIQLVWNGEGSGTARFFTDNDNRGAFYLLPNKSGAAPLPANSQIPLNNKASKVFTVSYRPPGGRRSAGDQARLVFQDVNNPKEAIYMNVNASGRVGEAGGFANNSNNFNNSGSLITNSGTGNPGNGNGNTGGSSNAGNPGSGNPGSGNPGGNNGSNNGGAIGPASPGSFAGGNSGVGGSGNDGGPGGPNPGSSGANAGIGLTPGSGDGSGGTDGGVPLKPLLDDMSAQAYLDSIHDNRKDENHLRFPTQLDVTYFEFKKDPKSSNPDKFATMLNLAMDTLKDDPYFRYSLHHVAAITDNDSIELQNLYFEPDSAMLRVGIHPDDEDKVEHLDSFIVSVGLIPYYISEGGEVYLPDQMKLLRGKSYGKIVKKSNWLLWLLIGIASFFILFFLLGRLWIRRPIRSFRYLREARYQRQRFQRQEKMETMPTETIYLDLTRRETDLVQLNFLQRNEEDPENPVKFKEMEATVQAPHRRGLRRFFIWFYGLFGVDKEPRFNSVYYSFRIEPQKGGIPQNLRLKDRDGLMLIGTSLTQNVLSTDHQDFRFRKRPFNYTVYLDPSEILEYTGTMPSVTLLYRVVEEPFEGYFITRDFKVDLEIPRRY